MQQLHLQSTHERAHINTFLVRPCVSFTTLTPSKKGMLQIAQPSSPAEYWETSQIQSVENIANKMLQSISTFQKNFQRSAVSG